VTELTTELLQAKITLYLEIFRTATVVFHVPQTAADILIECD